MISATLLLSGCHIFPWTSRAPTPEVVEHGIEPHTVEEFDTLERLAIFSLATERTSFSPLSTVHDAVSLARHACGELHSEIQDDPLAETGLSHTSPRLDASFRVEHAVIVAAVATTPSPEPRPVSIERQILARDERNVGPGELHLNTLNTRERTRIRVYDNAGRMRPEAIGEVAWALRDQRAGVVRTPHPRLIVMLYIIGQHYDSELEVVSGFRIGGENASRGSRHASAEAADFRIRGVGPRELARFAEQNFAHVGVGYYPTSNFVHIDNRRQTFYWVDHSGPGQRSRTRARSIDVRANPANDVTLRSVHVTEEELYVLPPSWSQYGYD